MQFSQVCMFRIFYILKNIFQNLFASAENFFRSSVAYVFQEDKEFSF